jgi:DNA helicase-2/ATP-dependent DNA helicase PcrA
MNTRDELEEERRLFYVALTRAESRATLTYTQCRYRWGKLNDAEPSRFLTELNPEFIDNQVFDDDYRFKPLVDNSIFEDVPKDRVRFKKPTVKPKSKTIPPKAKLKPVLRSQTTQAMDTSSIQEGVRVNHSRFGKGVVCSVEGSGGDAKALIDFENGGKKNLLLRFAKLDII